MSCWRMYGKIFGKHLTKPLDSTRENEGVSLVNAIYTSQYCTAKPKPKLGLALPEQVLRNVNRNSLDQYDMVDKARSLMYILR